MELYGQSFHTSDIPSVLFLVLLEGLLSADNALVLAIMVRHLPREAQKKALLYGLGGAFVFRFVAILFATLILKLWWLQAIGALYLLFMTVKHFVAHSKTEEVKPVNAGFWRTVVAVELTDIAFAIDSVLAGVTFINNEQSKIWVVILGAIIGIVLLRFAASLFIKLLDRYPALDHVAYALVGWVAVKLSFLAGNNFSNSHPGTVDIPHLSPVIFWSGLTLIATVGTILAVRFPKQKSSTIEADVKAMEAAEHEIPGSVKENEKQP